MIDSSGGCDIAVGILHTGKMGVCIASALRQAGADVHWAKHGRSDASRSRAIDAGLIELQNLEELCRRCEFVFSVCPPEHAHSLAESVRDTGFTGVYIDCNAISPASSNAIDALFDYPACAYIDAGIIGPPASKAGTTRLYLSGDNASKVAQLFPGSLVEAIVVDEKIGSASALKMAYAGWTKGSSALLMTQYAMAQHYGVTGALEREWSQSLPGVFEQMQASAKSTAPKAWRFVGEMTQIADTLQDAGLPRAWFEGAAASYARLSDFKDLEDVDSAAVIARLAEYQAL